MAGSRNDSPVSRVGAAVSRVPRHAVTRQWAAHAEVGSQKIGFRAKDAENAKREARKF